MPHRQANVKACLEILDEKLTEYIQTHKEWSAKGFLCPHTGNPKAHETMDEIIEDVKHARDMLNIALYHAEHDHHDITPHGAKQPEQPAHAAAPVRATP